MLGCRGPRAAHSGHKWWRVTGTAFPLPLQLDGRPSWSRTKTIHRKDWPKRWVVVLGVEQVCPGSITQELGDPIGEEPLAGKATASPQLEGGPHPQPRQLSGHFLGRQAPFWSPRSPQSAWSRSQGPGSFPIPELGIRVFLLCLVRVLSIPTPRHKSDLRPLSSLSRCYQPQSGTC